MALTKISRSLLDTGISDSSDATAITISSSEQVMIGTTDAGYPDYGDSLTVADVDGGGGNAGMTIRSGTSSYGTFYFSDATGTAAGTYAGKMQYNHNTNSMVFGTNSSDRLTIDSSGNVGIGVSSLSQKLEVSGNVGITDNLGVGTGSSSPNSRLQIKKDGTSNYANQTFTNADSTAGITFGIAGSGTGNYLANNAFLLNTGSSAFIFGTSDTERMRIDSSGILMKGKTTAGATSTEGFEISNNGLNMYMTQTSGSVTSTMHVLYGSTFKYYVGYDGQVYAANTSITSLSDERLKENVKDLDTGLSDILELKPKRFDWKEGEGTGEKNVSGFIAQDVEDTNFSDLVGNFKHTDLDDCKSFQYSGLIPALVKAIQELSAKVEELESKINE